MHKFIRAFRNTTLVLLGCGLIFWKFFALSFIPVDHPIMSKVLRYIQSPLAESWVDFHRGNLYFLESQTSKSGEEVRKMLTLSIDAYARSLSARETTEARENLEFVRKLLRSSEQEMHSQESTQKTPSQESTTEGKPEESSWEKGENTTGTWTQASWVRWFSNTGTFQTFSWSTGTGGELSESDTKKLKQSLESLRSLQKNKSEYTRPEQPFSQQNPIDSIFDRYFWGDRWLFRNETDSDPYDY